MKVMISNFEEILEAFHSIKKAPDYFKILGIHEKELQQSRMLAYLLAKEAPLPNACNQLISILKSSWRWNCKTEYSAFQFESHIEFPVEENGRIDLLLFDHNQKFAVAVETKVWAEEQPRQIERYQNYLNQEWKQKHGYECIVVFLSPMGALPKTENLDLITKGISCIPLAWKEILPLIQETRDPLLNMFRQNIQRTIMNTSEEKQILKTLAEQRPEFAKLFQTILANAPQFSDMIPAIIRGIERIAKQKVEYKEYPERGATRELIITIKGWREQNIPFSINFNNGDGTGPACRIMIHECNYSEQVKESLEKSNPAISIRPHTNWKGWYLALAEHTGTDLDWPKIKVEDLSYSDAVAEKLIRIFEDQYRRLGLM